jgi:uncharacterized protein HemX
VSEQQTKVETNVKRSKGGLFFSLFLLLLIIGVAAIAAYEYFQIEQIRSEHKGMGGNIERDDKRVQALTDQITSLQTQLSAIQSQLATVDSEVTQLEPASASKSETIQQTLSDFSGLQSEKLAANKKELLLSIDQIKRQLGKTRGDWLIADAEYLLSIANQRLHLLNDFHTTIEALQAADQRLRESGDTGVIKVREQLAKELGLLKDIEVLDVVGVYSRIKLLAVKAEIMAIFLPYAGKPSTNIADLPEQLEISGIEAIDETLADLKGLVTIRRTDQPVKAIISSNNVDFIRQQLKVKLQIAIISLVNNNEELYLSSMNDAGDWVQNNFAKNKDAKRFIEEINALKDIPLHNKLPDISLSLKMLRDISKLRLEADKALLGETTNEPDEATKPVAKVKNKPQQVNSPSKQPVAEVITEETTEIIEEAPPEPEMQQQVQQAADNAQQQ